MRDLRTSVRLAQEVGARLGARALLQRCLPSRNPARRQFAPLLMRKKRVSSVAGTARVTFPSAATD
jgi:hypothetical protein